MPANAEVDIMGTGTPINQEKQRPLTADDVVWGGLILGIVLIVVGLWRRGVR